VEHLLLLPVPSGASAKCRVTKPVDNVPKHSERLDKAMLGSTVARLLSLGGARNVNHVRAWILMISVHLSHGLHRNWSKAGHTGVTERERYSSRPIEATSESELMVEKR
jgi:hypothetical protein